MLSHGSLNGDNNGAGLPISRPLSRNQTRGLASGSYYTGDMYGQKPSNDNRTQVFVGNVSRVLKTTTRRSG